MARNQIKYRARLAVDIEEGLPPVMANEGNLAQVFLNLLVNAAQAIGEGAAEANMIKVRAFAGGGRVYAEVSDTGKGIPKEIQSRIFEPFYTTKAVGMGSGLGLSICHGIITSLGGEISFTSEDGKGSIFRLWLPSALVRLEALPGKGPAAPAVEGPARSGRILVIDDESGIRDVFKGLFGADHEVVEAASGERAQEILKEDTGFDAILCDLMMPGMSGLDLHRWLAQDCPGLARRVIFITGGAFAAGAQEYLAALENPRFEKPFDIAKVVGAVNQLINSAVKKD
jgi:CheY-like chemotaxis protein